MAVRIVVDSSADFELQEIDRLGLTLVPLNVIFEDGEFKDTVQMDKAEFYHRMVDRKMYPKTSQPSPDDFTRAFEPIVKNGDSLVYLTISSQFSGTYQTAMLARSAMEEADRIFIVDTLNVTSSIRILAQTALKMAGERENMDSREAAAQIAEAIEALKPRVKLYAALDTLEYLYLGGRLSRAQSQVGSVFQIKPIVAMTPEGTVKLIDKCVGRNRAMMAIQKHLLGHKIDRNYPIVYLYSYCEDNLNKMRFSLAEQGFSMPEEDVCQLGTSIGTHVGPNVYGFSFVEAE